MLYIDEEIGVIGTNHIKEVALTFRSENELEIRVTLQDAYCEEYSRMFGPIDKHRMFTEKNVPKDVWNYVQEKLSKIKK